MNVGGQSEREKNPQAEFPLSKELIMELNPRTLIS